MQFNQVTRVLSPHTRLVRDTLQKFVELDKHEIKDQSNVVVGWQLPKEIVTHEAMVKLFTVNGIKRVARSDTTDSQTNLTITKYTHRVGDVLIETTMFPEFLTIKLQ